MIIRTELLQDSCAKILNAVDSNVLSSVTETLEITSGQGVFTMAVTNREYFVEINMGLDVPDEFHATVNANLFLKLIAKITSETIELFVDGNSLHIKCNGDYKIPLIYDGEDLMKLPRISIENVNEVVDVDSKILKSLVNYNSKELQKGSISKPIQRLYYVDEKGAVTFTTGACINSFDIPITSKILLNDKLVKLFKLFGDTKVKMTIGHNSIRDSIVSTVVMLEAPGITVSAILGCDESMVVSFPVDGIRGRAESVYPHSISINKDLVIQAVDRLMLFGMDGAKSGSVMTVVKMEFSKNAVTISDRMDINREEIPYSKELDGIEKYVAYIDSSDLTKTLASCTNQFVTFNFGNSQAFVLAEGRIKWVIPECSEA